VQEGEPERALKALQQNGARPYCKAPPGRDGGGPSKIPCPAGCGTYLTSPNQVRWTITWHVSSQSPMLNVAVACTFAVVLEEIVYMCGMHVFTCACACVCGDQLPFILICYLHAYI
jgi:hypothetical protein